MNKKKITLKRDDILEILERRKNKYIDLYINEFDLEEKKKYKESINKIKFLEEFIKDSKSNDEIINFILKI